MLNFIDVDATKECLQKNIFTAKYLLVLNYSNIGDSKILTKEDREDNDDNKSGVFWSNKGGMLETSDDKCVVNRVVTGILATPRWLKP